MPRIKDEYLDCVLYLYPSYKDADEGSGIGGSGFVTAIPLDVDGVEGGKFWLPYAITNRHVVEKGNVVIRMSTRAGEKHIQETDERAWLFHPAGDDLAVCHLPMDAHKLRFNVIPFKDFLNKHDASRLGIGIGDDIFVVGRFINHEGRQKNTPTARFGHVAQSPNEPIKINGFDQECYLVEARSIGGFSGSPVFWQVLPFAGGAYRPKTNVGLGPYLLGIELGYIYDWTPVCDENGEPVNRSNPDRTQVQVNSGMMIVVPAWKLTELLNEDSLVAQREEIRKSIKFIPLDRPKQRGGVGLSKSRWR